jgi:pSer/pThr/pTyr-binding forkhead associated (FHA) protein
MAAMNRLVLNSGPTPGKEFPLDKPEVFIGRDIGNDVVINDPEVSRRHARIYLQGNMYIIEDLGSTNGTTVNGQKLTGPYMLRAGEQITFGEHVNLSFEAVSRIAEMPPAVQPIQSSPSISGPVTARPTYQAPVTPVQPPTYNSPVQQPPAYPQQQYPPYQEPYQQPPAYPQQQVFAQQPARQAQPAYQAPDALSQGQYSGQVPAPAYSEEPVVQYRIPIWMFVLIGVLLITIVVLLIDDFHLWCPLFGLC